MDDEIPVKLHFFDDDTIVVPFEFQPIDTKHSKDLKAPAIIKDTFSSTPDFSESAKKTVYGLHNKLLVRYKNDPENEIESALDLSFSRYYVIKPEEGKEGYGFSIVKNDTKYDFYCRDKQTYDNWFDALKRVCILCSFHEDFKAIKMIGRGSFAKVYLVESKTTGKSFAVKAFTKDSMAVTNKANAKPALLNEIDLMRCLDHENIIKLYEVYETDKSIYLVLELIQGKSLYDFLKKANFKEEVSATKIVNLVRSLLDALAYLASKGIMHRDLKPDNILLDKGEKVKIVDFGLATFIDVPNYIFKKCGTPGYIAPEVFKFDDKDPSTAYNDRCDVFSAGCLFYYMLFHTPLFPGATAGDILKLNKKFAPDYTGYTAIKTELENAQSKISKDGLALLYDLLEYDQHKRISASQALNHSYFIPVPMGMQKIAGSNEFVIDNASRFTQNEIFSPATSSPLKITISHTHSSQDQVQSPLTPLRLDPLDKDAPSPLLPNRNERFVKEDSLYLDLGKPEINGRLDTITSGSIGGSLLLNNNRADSTTNLAPHRSAFATERSTSRGSASGTKSYKNQGGTQPSSFLKAAILKNIQKNSSEGGEDALKPRFEDMRATRNMSENASPIGKGMYMDQRNLSESPGMKRAGNEVETNENENENENDEVKAHLDFGKVEGYGEKVGKGVGKPRKFQPFAPANLIIPKNENQSDV